MLTTALIVVPLVGAILVWVLPLSRESTNGLALLVALAELGLWLGSARHFDFSSDVPQYATTHSWFDQLGISYSVGLYGFQFWLVGLTIVVGACVVGYGAWAERERPRAYLGLMLFLVGSIVGVFAAQDLIVFYVFFEALLIPVFVLIGVWGGPQRAKATLTFVIYEMAGSLLMLASVIALGISQGTFSLAEIGTSTNDWVFLGFLVALAVRAPLLPFHGWLRIAYTEAPPEVSAVLSGLVSKTAVFGFVWIVLPHFPEPVEDFRTLVLVLAAATLTYGSVLAFRQPDIRGVIAYSSMGQMGLIMLGIFAVNDLGLDGAVLHSVNHGLVSAGFFLLAGMIEARAGTGEFSQLGGMAKGRPYLATLVMILGMFTLAVPGSTNFAGEFAILAGVFDRGWGYAAIGVLAMVLAAMYALRLISAILHERRGGAVREEAGDLVGGELVLLVPLVVVLAVLTAYPAGITERSFPSDQPSAFIGSREGVGVAVIETPHVDWLALAPTLALLAAAGITLLGAVLVPRAAVRGFSVVVSAIGYVTSTVLAIVVFDRSPEPSAVVAESMTRDRLGALAAILIAITGLVVALASARDGRRSHVGEYYALLATATAGMVFFVSSGSLMTMFLALEWLSISLYVLCALDTHRRASLEAGLKYLIVGSFGSGILLFGCALVYGATGELGFTAIEQATGADDPLFVTGMAMILAGLAFKVSAAPFHMWTPDVYEGAPTTVTAYMSAATKIAALVVMLRILVTAFPEQSEIWTVAVAVLAVCSLVIGNLAAIAQRDVKRLLAYSSVSHAGFLLIAIAADNPDGGTALLYYLIPYAAASVGAFLVVAAREREQGRAVTLDTIAGLGWERPFLGVCMWWFMLSLAGFPLTGGFLGKLFVFSAIFEAGWWWLVVIGVLATALSLAYYLNVIRMLYVRSEPQVTGEVVVAGGSPPRDLLLDTAVGAALVVTIGAFFFVQPLVDLASDAAAVLPF